MHINLFEALMAQSAFPRVLVVSTGGVYGSAVSCDHGELSGRRHQPVRGQ